MSISGVSGGPSQGETAEVPYATSIRNSFSGNMICIPTYSNGHRPLLFVYDANNGKMLADDSGFFTQLAAIPDVHGQWLLGRQYSNSFSIFDIPPTGKHPLNSFTFLGGPNQNDDAGFRYQHWTGGDWARLFSVKANPDNSADVTIDGVTTTKALRIGNGPVITSLSGAGAAGVASGPSTLSGTTGSIGGSPLKAGQCATGSAVVSGAGPRMAAVASPVSDPGDGFLWQAFISQPNTVMVKVCSIAGGTPRAIAYSVRVLP